MKTETKDTLSRPGRILPAGELLGDMLMEANQHLVALKEYEASQQREPNRFREFTVPLVRRRAPAIVKKLR